MSGIVKEEQHGMWGSPTYKTWAAMKDRCSNPNTPEYKYYGGRGIKIYEDWMDFKEFLKDMGERPEGKTLDRIDNNWDYEPGNCRWATKSEQSRNSRNSKLSEEDVYWIRSNKDIYSQASIARKFNVTRQLIHSIVHNKAWRR